LSLSHNCATIAIVLRSLKMEKIGVKNLLVSEIGTRLDYEINEKIKNLDLPEEVRAEKVSGKIVASRLEETIIVKGNLVADLVLICDRCLENFKAHIPFHLEREYNLNRADFSEESLYVDKRGDIDIEKPIREEIILTLPMQNFCKKNCKGICQNCGVNLNKEKCKCKRSKRKKE